MTQPRSVLFLCNHNAVRSPMAAALLRQETGGRVRAASCGVLAAEALDPFAEAVLAESSAAQEGRIPVRLETAGADWEVVVALTPDAERCADGLGLPALEVWTIEDPTLTEGAREQRLDAYRAVRDELRRRIRARFGA